MELIAAIEEVREWRFDGIEPSWLRPAAQAAAERNSRRSKPTPPRPSGNCSWRKPRRSKTTISAIASWARKPPPNRAKIQLEADKLHVSHVENLGRMAADMFGSQMDAAVGHHQAMQDAAVGHHQAFVDAAVGHHQANADVQSAQAQAGADVQSAQIQADAQPADDGS
jgi:hypothetical protein